MNCCTNLVLMRSRWGASRQVSGDKACSTTASPGANARQHLSKICRHGNVVLLQIICFKNAWESRGFRAVCRPLSFGRTQPLQEPKSLKETCVANAQKLLSSPLHHATPRHPHWLALLIYPATQASPEFVSWQIAFAFLPKNHRESVSKKTSYHHPCAVSHQGTHAHPCPFSQLPA